MTDLTGEIHAVLASINASWRERRPLSMLDHLHPEITMAYPGFRGTICGREAIIAAFAEFCENARVIEYAESDENIDVIGDSAVATFRFKMLYERATYREDSTGRDLWVFHKQGGRWVAVWRTLLDVIEERRPVGVVINR